MQPHDVAIVGGASLDVLYLHGKPYHSPGGAGMYTALAARWVGGRPLMFAPVPDPVPPGLMRVRERVGWVGPVVPPEELPAFEMVQTEDGHSRMISGRWGAEARLSPDDLPPAGLPAPLVYCGPLTEPQMQLRFLRHFHAAGQRTACGTYRRAVAEQAETVRATLALADVFFCNEEEACLLFGSLEQAATEPGQLLFITLGSRGALVLQGDYRTHVPGYTVEVVDTTGAGDTFCGVTLALLAHGEHPVMAARQAVACASEMVRGVGPERLLADQPPPVPLEDTRVRVNPRQVERVASGIAALPEVAPFDFTGAMFPPVGHPAALAYFFASVLQQFGFWSEVDERYAEPFVAPLEGIRRKGSDFLWQVYRRWLDKQPDDLMPGGQDGVSPGRFEEAYRDDEGRTTMPLMEERLALARAYGRDMVALGWTPEAMVSRANDSALPVQNFLTMLDHIGGYKEDPLRKKAVLLAIILQQRPERFLRIQPAEVVPPIIDYHLQRSCLRTGLVEVRDQALERLLVERRFLPPDAEWAVRYGSYEAIRQVQALSGKSMGAVDWFFFGARRRCPEMSEPECPLCPVEPVCVKAKELFQPVLRTTFY
jgi:ribokinase